MIDSKRYEEERKRINQKYGVHEKKPFNPNTSRYLEYRKQEKLRQEKVYHPENFIAKEQPVIKIPEPQIEPITEPLKKKSWFLKLLGR